MGVHADFWTVTREALDYSLTQTGIAEQGLADELMTLYLKLDPYDDVKSSLAAIRARGKQTAILSNGSPSMLDSIVRHAGLENSFTHVLSVEEVGIYKPSRRVYRLAMQKFHIIDAPSICFVSANTWDAQGAAHFGFQVARLARKPAPDERLPGKPKAVIHSLTELVPLI
jgi:2-haloacid dehalogenase